MRASVLVLGFLACAGCGTAGAPLHAESPAGTWHVVAPGETLGEISERTGTPIEDIIELNGIRDPDRIDSGRVIFLLDQPRVVARRTTRTAAPSEYRPPPSREAQSGGGHSGATGAPASRPSPAPRSSRPVEVAAAPASPTIAKNTKSDRPLRWPVAEPYLASAFGSRNGRPHEGIDFSAKVGTPVVAAAAGQVMYAGNGLRGYGNLIVLQHSGDLVTVYAHNSELIVREGEYVTAGQLIARVGQTGNSSGPHLHFEVREAQIPRDPIPYLPPLGGP